MFIALHFSMCYVNSSFRSSRSSHRGFLRQLPGREQPRSERWRKAAFGEYPERVRVLVESSSASSYKRLFAVALSRVRFLRTTLPRGAYTDFQRLRVAREFFFFHRRTFHCDIVAISVELQLYETISRYFTIITCWH